MPTALSARRTFFYFGVRVENPCDGKVYVYLTSEMTLAPGLLVLLYKTRWEIEKVFDETKPAHAEAWIYVTMIGIMLRRLA